MIYKKIICKYLLLLTLLLFIAFIMGMVYKHDVILLAPMPNTVVSFYLNANLLLNEVDRRISNLSNNKKGDSTTNQKNYNYLNLLRNENLSNYGIRLENVFIYLDKNLDFACIFSGKFDVGKIKKLFNNSFIFSRENGFAIPIGSKNVSNVGGKDELILHICSDFAFISKVDLEGNILDALLMQRNYLSGAFETFEKMVKRKPLLALEAIFDAKLRSEILKTNFEFSNFDLIRFIFERKVCKLQIAYSEDNKDTKILNVSEQFLRLVENKVLGGKSENVSLFKTSTTQKSIYIEAADNIKVYEIISDIIINYFLSKAEVIFAKYESIKNNRNNARSQVALKEM